MILGQGGHGPAGNDPHLLMAQLRRGAVCKMSSALGEPLMVLAVSAGKLPLSPQWRRKLQELEATL